MNRKLALVLAILFGFAAVAIPTALQNHFPVGSVPDVVCNMMLAPGWLIAGLFHDRDLANPEFLLLSRLITFILFGAVAYAILSLKKPSI